MFPQYVDASTPVRALTSGALAVSAACFLVACASSTKSTDTPSSQEASHSQTVILPERTLSMAFAGDMMFEQHLRPLAENPDSLVELQSTLGNADLSVANLETSITDRGIPWPGKPFTFRTSASALDAIATAGVDALTMANNHAFDYGDEGAEDTLAAKDNSPIPIVGIGRTEDEAYAPATLEVNGVKVAVLGASEVIEETLMNRSARGDSLGIAAASPEDRLERLVAEVRKAKDTHDVVVVMMHWGIEAEHCPGDSAIATSQALEQAGADAIIGSHAHRVNGHGWVGNAYVHYGTGNFVYYLNRDTAGHTGVLTLQFTVPETSTTEDAPQVGDADVTAANWEPMLIGGDGVPRPAVEVAGQATADELTALTHSYRECTPARAER